jgi:hypothetical protein
MVGSSRGLIMTYYPEYAWLDCGKIAPPPFQIKKFHALAEIRNAQLTNRSP